jgi:hypothetical protein
MIQCAEGPDVSCVSMALLRLCGLEKPYSHFSVPRLQLDLTKKILQQAFSEPGLLYEYSVNFL